MLRERASLDGENLSAARTAQGYAILGMPLEAVREATFWRGSEGHWRRNGRGARAALRERYCRLNAEAYEAIAAGDVIQGRHVTPGGVLAGGLRDGVLGRTVARDAAEVRAAWPTLSLRERDKLVAEAAGWVDLHFFDLEGLCGRREHAGSWSPVPHYSTEWEDAGPLLEWLAGLWGDFECGQSPKDQHWYVDGPWSRDAPMGAPSLVESIALAFVLAKLDADDA